ncbi:MAG: leucine-rich repeat protein, partial [Firmicutes bacterium]|nr:leucine-rich repeat protein [Bacillota bacterium]
MESVVIQDGVKSIQPFAFYQCSYLKNIDLPDRKS